MIQIPGISVRPVQDSDFDQVVNLDRLSFAPTQSNAVVGQEWFGGTLNLPDRALFLAIEEMTGDAIGSYAQVELDIFLAKRLLPAMGIAAVAVAPHRRGQRIAQLMLEHSLETARERRLPLVMLYPFQHGFYRKLGWAWVGAPHQYRISTRHLPLYTERQHIIPYHPERHQEAVKTVYQMAASHHNGWLQRRQWQWDGKLKPANGKEIYCYVTEKDGGQGNVQGYVMLQFAQLESTVTAPAIVVQEWAAVTMAAYRGILGFLASLRDQVSTIVWNTYATDPFPHLLKEQRRDPNLPTTSFDFGLTHRFAEIGGGFMWRLVDLEVAFQQRPIAPSASFPLTFQVTDPILGNSTLTIAASDGKMQIQAQPAPTSITTSIEHLTVMFAGFRRPTDLLATGEIEVTGDRALLNQLDTAWQTTPPFCWDFF